MACLRQTIPLIVEKDSGKERVVSDRNGNAVIQIRDDGRIRISANAAGENPDYGKIVVVRNIVKMRNLSGLISSLSAVALVALIAIAVVYAAPRGLVSPGRKPSVRSRVHGREQVRPAKQSSLSGSKGRKPSLSRK